jgi:hypothetical protein
MSTSATRLLEIPRERRNGVAWLISADLIYIFM